MRIKANCNPALFLKQKTAGCITKTLLVFGSSGWRFDLATKRRMLMQINLLFAFMTLALLNVSAKGLSQQLNFTGKNVPLTKVFSAIKKQTDYVIFYDNNLLKNSQPVTLNLKNVSVEELLYASLKNQDLDFSINDKTISLKRKLKYLFAEEILIEEPVAIVEVRGRILNEQGDPLVGVTVSIKGTKMAVVTNDKGEFEIRGNENEIHTLVLSYVGFETQEIVLYGRTSLNVTMKLAENNGLGEVVVTALGITRSSKTLTYSVQQVKGDDLNEVKNGSVLNGLEGKISGLQISQSTSGPGGATRILMRGNRSIQGSNNALIVVDGVAIDNSLPHGGVTTDGGYNSLDGAANINPDDIQSVTVLKGASAAALYGSRAANGVIMINTKKGRAGKMQVDVNSGIATETVSLMPSLQNTFGQGAGGLASTEAVGSWGPKGATTYPDNIKDLFRNGLNVNNAVGVTAGQEKIQGYFSYANDYMEGVTPRNDLKRNTLNLRLSTNPIKKLTTDLKITYVNQYVSHLAGGGEGSPLGLIYRAPRSVSTEQMEDYVTLVNGREKHKYWISSSLYTNPYWAIYRKDREITRDRITMLGSVKYQFTNWLDLQLRYSLDKYTDVMENAYYDGSPNLEPGGRFEQNDFSVRERNMDLLLTGNNNLSSSFKVTYNLGASLLDRSFGSNKFEAIGLQVPNKFNLNFASSITSLSTYIESQLQSVYGTAQLSFRDYLFLDLTARNDWSSTLPTPYSYFYPSVGLSAVLSDAFRMPEPISFARVRLSHSEVGNEAQPYLLNPVYNFSQGGTAGFIIRSSSQPIPNLKPEKTKSIEAGADVRFFNDRLGIDVTYYKTNSSNQLLSLSVSPVSGYLSKYLNAGNIQNNGWEITLNANPVKGSRFNWNILLNYARNRGKVISLSEDVKESILLSGFMHLGTVKVAEGGAYGDLYAYGWARNDKGEYLVDDLGLPIQSELKKVGNYNPDYTVGLGNHFSYGNWVASVLISGRVGGEVLSASQSILAQLGNTDYTEAHRDGGWILTGAKGDGTGNAQEINAEQFWNKVGGNYAWGEFFTYDATNFRVREASIGYSFHLKESGFIKGAKLSAVAKNLFFLYRGKATLDIPGIGKRKLETDPEITGGTGNLQGIEFVNLPTTRILGLNLKLTL